MGKSYTAPDGKTFRPSMFLTLRARPTAGSAATASPSTPPPTITIGPPATRWPSPPCSTGSSRTYALGRDLQYFAAIEPQRRLAPHVHIAMRGTVARAEIRRVLAATYHQVWWPDTSTVKYDG